MNKIIYIFLIPYIIFTLTGCENKNETDNSTDKSSNVQRLEVIKEENPDTENSAQNAEKNKELSEEELFSFSTKILAKEVNRVSNIKLACSTINDTTINPGEVFSFWGVIGNPTIDKGYKEAKAFTASGGVTTAIGGGLCQVSSTIYDVVLNVQGLETIERHQHTREVYYVKLGDDASVSYGSADFKFRNNLQNAIKIYAEATTEAVNIRFVKLV